MNDNRHGAKTTNPFGSILDQVRKEGYDQGRKDEKEYQSQIGDSKWFEIEEKARALARIDLRNKIPSRLMWYSNGVLSTVVVAAMLYSFLFP